jgi:hypothetical protein
MEFLFLLVGVVLILEGMPYVVFPESMRDWLRKLSEMKTEHMRMVGLFSMSIGLIICWLVKRSNYF